VRPAPFEVAALFGALRGMLRPLLVNQSLALVFEEPAGVPPILSDENKVSQILRNFISNALKYTEQGEVRVTARLTEGRDAVEFAVADTGIGIPEQDLVRVFDEFVQIENPLQRRVKGTGLGLPLSKRLAELLGGTIGVASTLGAGSRFAVTIPLVFHGVTKTPLAPVHAGRDAVLVVEDADEDMLLYERALGTTRFQVVPARSVGAALAALDTLRPAAIVMDIRLHGQEAWDLLARLKRDDRTRGIPVVVVSTIDDRHKGFALGADAYGVKPISREWLLETLEALTPQVRPLRVLAIDDEEAARFIVRELLNDGLYQLTEAASGAEGLRLAQEEAPDVLLLDFRLTDMTGIEVCDRLRRTAALSEVPVIVVTSHRLSADDRERFGAGAKILSKSKLTRDALRSAIQQAVPGRGVHP
jgi:CheY-like chemotaxis protein